MSDPTGIELRKYDDGVIAVAAGGKEFPSPRYQHDFWLECRNSVFNDGQPVYQRIAVRDLESRELVLSFGTRIDATP
jgi:hypothetical protein